MTRIKSGIPMDEQIAIVEEYASEHISQSDIAREHDMSIRQIRNVLYNNGLASHPEGKQYMSFNDEDDTDISKEMVEKGPNIAPKTTSNKNVLIIPDLHAPFIRNGFLDFCKYIAGKWNCQEIYFLGDLLDNHYMSFHDTDPDGYSAKVELEKAIKQLKEFHKVFPVAKITMGNHDSIPSRKAFNAGISSRWIKSVGDILNFEGWQYNSVFYHNDIMICHGLGRKAYSRMKTDMVSVIQGHYHSESYIRYQVGTDRKTFAMQLGCGVDNNTFAMAYGKWYPRQHVNVGVLLEGRIPIIEYMSL